MFSRPRLLLYIISAVAWIVFWVAMLLHWPAAVVVILCVVGLPSIVGTALGPATHWWTPKTQIVRPTDASAGNRSRSSHRSH